MIVTDFHGVRAGLLAAAVSLFGCSAAPAAASQQPRSSEPARAQARNDAPPNAPSPLSASGPESTNAPPPSPCAPLPCELFDTPLQAFQRVLAAEPVVLAVGEAHAPADAAVESATSRFRRELMPALAGRATHLIVEVLIPDPRCFPSAKEVKERQQAVTEHQAATNQNEFVALGQRARELGIVPLPLRPSCDELSRVLAAGDDGIAEMLKTIARLTAERAKTALAENRAKHSSGVVLAYGGALHNDVAPRADHPEWQFGPELSQVTGGRYVELDLIVPEFIKDSEAWRSQPWYTSFDPKVHPERVTLIRMGPRSYALIFARSVETSPKP